jgi:hypothetical protein
MDHERSRLFKGAQQGCVRLGRSGREENNSKMKIRLRGPIYRWHIFHQGKDPCEDLRAVPLLENQM